MKSLPAFIWQPFSHKGTLLLDLGRALAAQSVGNLFGWHNRVMQRRTPATRYGTAESLLKCDYDKA